MLRHRMHWEERGLKSRRRNSAFTLVELLVVITIIALLMSILVMTVGNVMEAGKIASTEATINKLKALLNDRMESFNMAYEKNQYRSAVLSMERTLRGQGFDATQAGILAPILGRKKLEREILPQMFSETNSRLSAPTNGKHNPVTESSEVLYWLLTQAELRGSAPIEESAFNSNEVADTDGDGLKEFVDAWGQPLRFYRWPTRLIRPGTSSTAHATVNTPINTEMTRLLMPDFHVDYLVQDPDDPLGDSRSNTNYPASTGYDPAEFEDDWHTESTLHPFLIVSAGPDGELGLEEPYDKTKHGHLARPLDAVLADPSDSVLNDNITNRRAAGAK